MRVDGKVVVRRCGAVALLVVLLAVTVGCGSGGGEAEQQPDSRDEPPGDDDDGDESRGAPGEDAPDDGDEGNDDAGEDAEAAARQAYVDYQTMFERLVIDPDSDDPEIEQLTSGEVLNHVVDVLTRYETRDQAVEFGTDHEHNVFEVTVGGDGTATVRDCFVSDARVVNATTRAVLSRDPEGGAANVVTATVVRGEEGWRVDATDAVPVEPGDGCGADGVIHGS